jgi:8-amino-7-oxononanoate synthase
MIVRMGDALGWLADAAEDRIRRGLNRKLVPRGAGDDGVLDLAGNDYLGLARHPSVVDGAIAAVRSYGAGSTGSRLVTGTTELHQQLERALARFVGTETALVFSSGYAANLGGVTALSGPGSLVVSDAGNHASLVDACRLSRARVVVVPTGDLAAVERALAGRAESRALVVTDGVFSVSGSRAPVGALHALARQHGAALLVDEAHALGVVGSAGTGVCAAAGIAGEPDVVITATMSKALGSQGGAVLGSRAVQMHLVDTARTFIFDTALAPGCAGAALAALELVTAARVGALRHVVTQLATLLELPATDAAVLPVPIGDADSAVAARDACAQEHVRVGCFRPPSVPPGGACLRLTGRADLTDVELRRGAAVVQAAVAAAMVGAA